MADIPVFVGTVKGSVAPVWELVPAVTAGSWLWQNAGRYEARVMVTDGPPPTDADQGERLGAGEWTPFRVETTGSEVLYVSGSNVRLFVRQFA